MTTSELHECPEVAGSRLTQCNFTAHGPRLANRLFTTHLSRSALKLRTSGMQC